MTTILVIDDEADVRDFISEIVNQMGYPTLKVDPKNEDVLVLVRRVRPAIVITDLVMPNTGGSEITKVLRTEFPDMGIIIATGYSENSADLLRLGANVVVSKPINAPELENQIKLCIKEKKAG